MEVKLVALWNALWNAFAPMLITPSGMVYVVLVLPIGY